MGATKSGGKLELLAESGDFFKTHALDYAGGLRYPQLGRAEGKADVLGELLKPKSKWRHAGGAAGAANMVTG